MNRIRAKLKSLRTKITLTTLAICALNAMAVNDRNYVFLFDCTASMKDNKCWESAKGFLKNQVEMLDPYSNVTIIPFQDKKNYPPINFVQRDFDWKAVESKFNEYIKNRHGGTGICDVWSKAMTKLEKGVDNYVVLLTDGREENTGHGQADVVKLLKKWKQDNRKDAYAFYVMLAPDANDMKRMAGGDGRNLFFIDANGKIPNFASIGGVPAIDSFLFSRPQRVTVPVSCGGEYKGVTVSSSDPHFSVSLVDGKISDGKAEFEITNKHGDVSTLNALIGKSHEVRAKVDGSASGLTVVNDFALKVVNKPERVLSSGAFNEDKPNIGKVHYYPKFLFWNEKKIDTVAFEFTPEFNDMARASGSTARFTVLDDGTTSYSLIIAGAELNSDSTFTVTPATARPVKVKVVFDNGAEDNRYKITLVAYDAARLDRIQATSPASDFSYEFYADFERDWNPLAHILLWIGVVLFVLLVLWFALLKRTFYPVIKVGTMQISSPYFSMRKIKGARRVILSSKPHKQSIFSRFFTGKIVSDVNPVWSSGDVVLEPASKGRLKLRTGTAYSVDPFAFTLIKGVDYVITDGQTNDKIDIRIY